jgi:hypothetical protein
VADINLGVQIGHDTQTISLTSTEWMVVKSGEHFVKDAQGFYEGEEFTYTWYFNDPRFVGTSLVVHYGDAEGFQGSIEDALTTWV